LRTAIDILAEKSPTGSTHVVMKSPSMLGYWRRILELLPELKTVCIVRDPRSTLNSILKVREKAEQSLIVKGVDQLCLDVNLQLHRIEEVHKHGGALLVRYEDLARRDSGTAESISAFLNITLSYDLPDDTAEFDPRSAWYSPLYAGEVTNKRVGSWNELDHDTLKRAEDIFGWFLRWQRYK
jgi:hypothetical protein